MSGGPIFGGWPPIPPRYPPVLGGGRPASLSALAELLNIPEKRKIFVSYHHAGDQGFYNALAKLVDDCEFLQDKSVDRLIGVSDDAEYQERRIREEFITGSSATVVLCGPKTPWRKFVDWEIYGTLYKEHGLIGLQLPHLLPDPNRNLCIVPDRLHDNVVSGYAVWRTWSELASNQNPAAILRGWIEQAVAKDKGLIRNSREKRARNG